MKTRPLTPETWPDLVRLFGARGACAGCWCMYHRLQAKEWTAGKGATNKRKLKRLVDGGRVPGLIGYEDGEPVAWCSVEPRANLPRLARSRVMRAVDDKPVWSIDCLFVRKDHRRRGVSVAMLEAAAEHARAHGAEIVEGYPVVPKKAGFPDTFAYYGLVSAFRRAGFRVVARPSDGRAVVRKRLEE